MANKKKKKPAKRVVKKSEPPKINGRPPKYDPKFSEMLIWHMAEGLSFESFAAVIDVTRDCLYKWCGKHPGFLYAKRAGFQKSRLYWEKMGRAGCAGKLKGFSAAGWIFNMKNRHGWADLPEPEDDDDQGFDFVD